MTAEIVLNSQTREKKNSKKRGKKIPAVMYGPEVKENKLLWVDELNFEKAYNEVGESALIDLKIDDQKEPHEVLIYDVQSDPVKNQYLHVDFFKVKKGKKIEVEVELEFVGESPAVKELGAILVKNTDYIEIRCLPKDLPKQIPVDLSALKKIDDAIRIKDLGITQEMEVLWDAETVVAMVEAPRSEKELEELDEKVEADMDKIGDVETKKAKEEKETGEEAGGAGESKKEDK